MELTNFGQIAIYNEIFSDVCDQVPKYDPQECINYGKSYSLIYNKKEIPIMIGSNLHIHKNINPLNISGYFIIDGICKSINNIKKYHQYRYTKDRAILSDNSEIHIENMFSIKKNGKKFKLPKNWEDILKITNHKNELRNFLEIIVEIIGIDKTKILEIDIIILSYLFESWLDLRKPVSSYRIITAGELINMVANPVKYMKTNTWTIDKIVYNQISEDMKNNNIISDIEAIRKVTFFGIRENANLKKRMTKDEDKYILSGIHTPDGKLCGTVRYLCMGVKLKKKKIIQANNTINTNVFRNKKYINETNLEITVKDDKLNYIFDYYGEIEHDNKQYSYTESLIPYRLHNPPIRILFACSMLKQGIFGNYNGNKKLVNTNDIGFDLNVAIMPWYGYNVEDAVVISENVANKFEYEELKIYREFKVKIISINIKKGDIIYNNQLLYKKYDPTQIKTIELIYSEMEGIIKNIIRNENYLEITIVKKRKLEVGDKITSRHGQKSIISLILPENEMPYTEKDKIDLIMNPHAFPTRMTMGQIKEMGNKEEVVYLPNNNRIKNRILVGKCKYIALKHQVHNKMQWRNKGKYDEITKQPVAGRKVIGGLRVGQMEKEVLIAIGGEKIIKELWKSDLIEIKICEKTGKINNEECNCDKIKGHQFFIICLAYMRALGYDILFNKKEKSYSIIESNMKFKETDTLNFGDLDPLDIRIFKNRIILPMCLRNYKIDNLYKKYDEKEIKKEITKILKSKEGPFHKYYEGHRIDKCIRSVIVPNPKLEINEVEIPYGVNIECDYGILNRQPTLNVNSMAIVKLKSGKNKTIQINPLLCKSFNADFDGDEMNIYGISEKFDLLEPKPIKTQDYILGNLKELTETGLTANREGIIEMIRKKSKGEQFNYNHIYMRIGELIIEGKKLDYIDNNYIDGLTEDEWYECSKAAIESATSISINTPITGYLSSLCNQAYL